MKKYDMIIKIKKGNRGIILMGKRLKEYINPKMGKTRMITYMGLLIALDVVLTRTLSITTPGWRIGFGFVATSVTGYLFGPIWAAIGAALADVVGFYTPLNTAPYAYFYGYTISAALRGVAYGVLLYKCKGSNISAVIKCIVGASVVFVLLDLGLNGYWGITLTPQPYWTWFIANIGPISGNFAIRCIIMPVYILFMKRNYQAIFGR